MEKAIALTIVDLFSNPFVVIPSALSEDIKQFEDSINKFIGYLQSIGIASAFAKDYLYFVR